MTAPQPPTQQDDARIDAAEYALGLMSAQDARAFETRMSDDAALRQEYVAWAESFAALTEDIAPETPPEQVWNRLNAALPPAAPRSYWQQLRPLPYLLGGIVAAMLAWGALSFGWLQPATVPQLRAEIAGETDLRLVAVYAPSAGGLILERTAGGAPAGVVHQIWLIRAGAAPVSLGILTDTARSFVPLEKEQGAALTGATLAISREPQGGAPAGAEPGGPVVATGTFGAM